MTSPDACVSLGQEVPVVQVRCLASTPGDGSRQPKRRQSPLHRIHADLYLINIRLSGLKTPLKCKNRPEQKDLLWPAHIDGASYQT